ncbi:hypothetical protein J6590_026903 [Homalodisca vitripennis]|nr:hypothetical protein J6590_026903 [Homalodisca vitripennis]
MDERAKTRGAIKKKQWDGRRMFWMLPYMFGLVPDGKLLGIHGLLDITGCLQGHYSFRVASLYQDELNGTCRILLLYPGLNWISQPLQDGRVAACN